MPKHPSANVYLIGDAARALGCSSTHVGRLIRSGRATPTLRIAGGSRVAFTEDELLQLAQSVGRPIRRVSADALSGEGESMSA